MSSSSTQIQSGCYICGCARNCAQYLRPVFENVKKTGGLFSEYTVIIAYDDSSDNTLAILNELRGTINNKGCGNMIILQDTRPTSRMRTENIAAARNSIIRKIRELQCGRGTGVEYKYFIMMDLDDVCAKPINTAVLRGYFEESQLAKWDSLSFNLADYYDIWALSVGPYVLSCWHWNNNPMYQFMNRDIVVIMTEYVVGRLKALPADELLECYSAFNGFAVYKLSHFLDCSYDHNMFNSLKFVPQELIQANMAALGRPFYTYFEQDCEHRHFHFEAMMRNRAKIRISPLMIFG